MWKLSFDSKGAMAKPKFGKYNILGITQKIIWARGVLAMKYVMSFFLFVIMIGNIIMGPSLIGTWFGLHTQSTQNLNDKNEKSDPYDSQPNATNTIDNSITQVERDVITIVNKERANVGLKALKANAQLSNIARLKSRDFFDFHYFDHQSPTYGSISDAAAKFGISYSTLGENIAMGQTSPKQVMESWMNSPGHKRNILNQGYTDIGVGHIVAPNGTQYWTQMFMSS